MSLPPPPVLSLLCTPPACFFFFGKGVPWAYLLPAAEALGGRQDPQPKSGTRDEPDEAAHGGPSARRWVAYGRDGARLLDQSRLRELLAGSSVHELGRVQGARVRQVRADRGGELEEDELRVPGVQGQVGGVAGEESARGFWYG